MNAFKANGTVQGGPALPVTIPSPTKINDARTVSARGSRHEEHERVSSTFSSIYLRRERDLLPGPMVLFVTVSASLPLMGSLPLFCLFLFFIVIQTKMPLSFPFEADGSQCSF